MLYHKQVQNLLFQAAVPEKTKTEALHEKYDMSWLTLCTIYRIQGCVFTFCSCCFNSVLQEKYVETRTAEPGVLIPNIISHPSSPF